MGEDVDDESCTQGLYFVKEGTVECYIPYSEGKTDDAVFEYQIASENGYGIDTLKQQRKKNLGLPVKSLKKDIYLKNLVKNEYFGETSIFLNQQIPFSVKSVDFSTIYKISRKNFIESIKKFPDDYEIYCEIKDDLEFRQKRMKYPKFHCNHCNKNVNYSSQHQIIECPHLIPHIRQKQEDIDFVRISNLKQIRDRSFRRSCLKTLNCLSKFQMIQILAKKATLHFGAHVYNDDLSVAHSMSFLSQASHGAIIEYENESDYEEDDEEEEEEEVQVEASISPKRFKRKNHKFRTLTDDVSNMVMQQSSRQSNTPLQDQLEQSNQSQQQYYLSEQEGYTENLQQLRKMKKETEDRSFVAIVSDDQDAPKQLRKQTKRSQTQKYKLPTSQADYISALKSGIQHQQPIIDNPVNSEEIKNIRLRSRLMSTQLNVRTDSTISNKYPQNSLFKNQAMNNQLDKQKSNNISVQENQQQQLQQSIPLILENYLSEFRQIIQAEFSKNKMQSSNPYQFNRQGSINVQREFSDYPTPTAQPSFPQVNKQTVESQYQQEIENEFINNQNNYQMQDVQATVHQDIDRMFKFRTYKKHFNYDVVLRKERERVKRQMHLQNNKRKSARSKPNLNFKARRVSNNIEFSALGKQNSTLKDRAPSSNQNFLI